MAFIETSVNFIYVREIRWIGEADEVAEQRGSVSKQEIQHEDTQETCREGGREGEVIELLDKHASRTQRHLLPTVCVGEPDARTAQHQDEEERQDASQTAAFNTGRVDGSGGHVTPCDTQETHAIRSHVCVAVFVERTQSLAGF